MKIIKGFEDYGITKDAKVYSFKSKKWLKPGICKGYAVVCLMSGKRKVMKRRARLVYETYKGKIPKGYTVDHLKDKLDDRLESLDCCTLRQNIKRYWKKQA